MRLPKIPSNLVTSEQRPLFEKLNTGIRENLQDFTMLEAAGKGTKMAAHFSPSFRSRLSLFSDLLRTVLAVKGSLRRAQQRRALDRSGPF